MAVEDATVNTPILIFLDWVADDFDVMATVIQNALFDRVSTLPLATCSQISSVLWGNDSTKYILPS